MPSVTTPRVDRGEKRSFFPREKALRIPFPAFLFGPSHVCSVSHLRPKAGGEWMSFRFCRSGAVEKVRHKRRKCAKSPASRADMRVDGPCARWGDRARLVGRARAGAVALVGKGDRVMSWLRRRMVSGLGVRFGDRRSLMFDGSESVCPLVYLQQLTFRYRSQPPSGA